MSSSASGEMHPYSEGDPARTPCAPVGLFRGDSP